MGTAQILGCIFADFPLDVVLEALRQRVEHLLWHVIHGSNRLVACVTVMGTMPQEIGY